MEFGVWQALKLLNRISVFPDFVSRMWNQIPLKMHISFCPGGADFYIPFRHIYHYLVRRDCWLSAAALVAWL